MINKNNFTYRKRLNTQIITKTQLALQAIKRYDMQQSRVNFDIGNAYNARSLLNQLDNDFSKVSPHRKIELDRNYKINLFAYSQQFYFLEMFNYIFPMRMVIKNVRNEGTIYIGYDQEYPGIYLKDKFCIFEKETVQQKNYDYKTTVNRDLLITLKNKGNQMIKNIYFTFVAGPSSLMMFDFKVEFIGFLREERVMSEVKLPSHSKIMQKQKLMTEQSMPLIDNNRNTQKGGTQFVRSKNSHKLQKIERLIHIDQFQIMSKHQLPKHFSKANISPQEKKSNDQKKQFQGCSLNLNKTKSQSLTVLRVNKGGSKCKLQKSELDCRLQQAKRNKQILDDYKQKDKQLKETANKCKRMIQKYQKVYNQENVRGRRLNKDLVLTIKTIFFIKLINEKTQKRDRKNKMQFKIIYLCKKFIKNLKASYYKTCYMINSRQKRVLFESLSFITLEAKTIQRQSIQKSSKIINFTINQILPCILINNAFNQATKYRTAMRLIQQTWKTKYHSRIYCLLYFIDNHVKKMMQKFPHLNLHFDCFYKQNHNQKICLDYIKDESQKYRLIYDDYCKQIEEIQEMVKMQKFMIVTKSLAKSKQKKFQIPKKPIKPMHRFFRNLDILKSMVRSWFQIQYKTYMKKAQTIANGKK